MQFRAILYFFATLMISILLGCGEDETKVVAGSSTPVDLSQSQAGLGQLFQPLGNPIATVQNGNLSIPVYPGAKVSNNGNPVTVYFNGAGIRQKSVVVTTVDVMVVVSYADAPRLLKGSGALNNVQQSKTEVIRMTFLREVTADQIKDSFLSAVEANGYATNSEFVQSIAQRMQTNAGAGDSITVVSATDSNGVDTVTIESPQGVESMRGAGLGRFVWMLWYGTPADDDVAHLKQQLIQ